MTRAVAASRGERRPLWGAGLCQLWDDLDRRRCGAGCDGRAGAVRAVRHLEPAGRGTSRCLRWRQRRIQGRAPWDGSHAGAVEAAPMPRRPPVAMGGSIPAILACRACSIDRHASALRMKHAVPAAPHPSSGRSNPRGQAGNEARSVAGPARSFRRDRIILGCRSNQREHVREAGSDRAAGRRDVGPALPWVRPGAAAPRVPAGVTAAGAFAITAA